jgi:hypothetical protein
MSWANKRSTTVKEDKIYCLLGTFGVFLPLDYGEGAKYAEERLREEVARRQLGRGIEDLHDLPGAFVAPATICGSFWILTVSSFPTVAFPKE